MRRGHHAARPAPRSPDRRPTPTPARAAGASRTNKTGSTVRGVLEPDDPSTSSTRSRGSPARPRASAGGCVPSGRMGTGRLDVDPEQRASGCAASTGAPWISARPAVGRAIPTIAFSAVVLPAPFGPRKPVTAPGRTLNDKSSTATSSPYRFVRPSTVIAATTGGTRVVFIGRGSAAPVSRTSARRPNFVFDPGRM